ncbi:hypothetical protein AAZX31_17G157300 [Glycine max]
MSNRKYESGYEKLKKKRKVEKLIESQHGALDKFAIIHKNDAEASSIGENVIEQPLIDHTDNEENVIEQPPIDNTDNGVEQPPRDDTDNGENVIEQPPINNTDNTNSHNFNQELEDNILEIGVEGNVEHNNTSSEVPTNIYDPELWKNIDGKFRNLMIEKANEGTKYWKNLGSKLNSHETNCEHIINMTKWIELEKRLTPKQTIDKHIQEQINKEKEHWEKVLLRIIAIVKYLSKNNLAFRGTNEKIYEKGNDNFLSLIEILAEFDPIMQEHVRRIKINETRNHFLSNTIQNELIEMIAFQVKNHQEQMTLILRCVDTSKSPIKIEEYFLEFLKVDDTSRKGLFNELVNVLKKYGHNIDDIRAKNQGVQRRLLDINPRAFYTLCGCHNLNSVLCDMASSSPRAISFFGVLQRIYSLFASSTKRWKILQDNVSKFFVKSLSQTRWESRIESVKAIKFQAPKVRDALTELSKTCEDPKLKSEAMSLATHELEDFEFLLGMNIWYDILFAVNSVSKILQSKDMHIDVAIDHLKGLITYLKHYRENGFALALESTEKMTIEMDIEPKFHEKQLKVLREVLREEISTPIEVLSYIKTLDSFPNVYIVYRILLTIPVTIATAERCFPKLKSLKSYLKSRMLQDILHGLAILSIESEVLELLDYKTLINDFAAKKVRRLI